MKRILFVCMLLLIVATASAQPGKKPAKEKPPTKKEMDDIMKEMQKAMDEMDPEDKKMMDSMGIKMPSAKSIPKFTDKDLADAWEADTRLVPPKNVAAIAAIPATPTTAALPGFISTVHKAVSTKLDPTAKTDAEKIYLDVKQQPGMSVSTAAIGFWIQGQPLLATWLMGRACEDEPQNIDHINNYAAMLSMNGAEHIALPVLQNLNKRFPKNSTVLNNIGQAWFGLGEIDKAGRYLDSAIRIYAYHSQANYTKCLIEESKGNTEAAVEALVRSVKKSHSMDKESKLRKLGRKLSGKDIDFPFNMPQDPLGLERFNWPDYPMTVAASEVLAEKWAVFKQSCDETLRQLNSRSAQLENIAMQALEQRTAALMKAAAAGKPFNALPWYAPAAALKLNYLVEDKDGGVQHQLVKAYQDLANAFLQDADLDKARTVAEQHLSDKYGPLIGEGLPNPLEEYCNAVNEVRNKYLLETNSNLQMLNRAAIEQERKWLNNQVYYAQYINWPEDFEVIKIGAKIRWLNIIKNQSVRFQSKGPFCVPENKEEKLQKTKLQAFDDVACKYHSSIDLGAIEFNNDCSRFEGKLKLGVLNYTRKIDSDDHDRLMAATLEITVSASKGWEKGPVQAEVKAEITGRLEWNDKGVTNWEVNSEVGVSAGSNLGHGDKSIDIAGIKANIGMNSGGRVQGNGLLQNLSITGK